MALSQRGQQFAARMRAAKTADELLEVTRDGGAYELPLDERRELSELLAAQSDDLARQGKAPDALHTHHPKRP